MTEQEMWEAVQQCDANYDGLFFYAVKTTHIFCRPSCKSKLPKRENVCYFKTAKDAENAGFNPCKRCRSDLLNYQPMRDIAVKIKEKIDNAGKLKQDTLSETVGLSLRRVTDIFKQTYGMTPKEYGGLLRLHTAKKLLLHTDKKIIDIAYIIGFSSLTTFNRFFKKQTGQAPTAYRKNHKCVYTACPLTVDGTLFK